MKVLIIEDEPLAAERIASLLKKYNQAVEILAIIDSVEETIKWFAEYPMPDLIMLDIHLSDGQSFEIFNKVSISSPIIFTTAYDQYAIQAFKVNSIDYLLKPVSMAELNSALNKLNLFRAGTTTLPVVDYSLLAKSVKDFQKSFKSRFLVKYGDHIQFKMIDDIAYFYADDKIVYLVPHDGKKFIVDYTIEELIDLLDPDLFYRLNRKFIIKLSSFKNIRVHPGNRLQVFLKPHYEPEIYVSRDKIASFKAWLNK